MSTKPFVYIASPYTKGDPAINTRFQCAVFDQLMNQGIVWPMVPLWSHFQHIVFPRKYEDWLAYDHAMIERCDALIRLSATNAAMNYRVDESSGADSEVEVAKQLKKPVFTSIEECYEWARYWRRRDA